MQDNSFLPDRIVTRTFGFDIRHPIFGIRMPLPRGESDPISDHKKFWNCRKKMNKINSSNNNENSLNNAPNPTPPTSLETSKAPVTGWHFKEDASAKCWQIFELHNEFLSKAKCAVCGVLLSRSSKSCTSNLNQHYEICSKTAAGFINFI